MDDHEIDVLVASMITGAVSAISYYFIDKYSIKSPKDKIISAESRTSSLFMNNIKSGLFYLNSALLTFCSFEAIQIRYHYPVESLLICIQTSIVASLSFLIAKDKVTLSENKSLLLLSRIFA